MTKLSQLQNSLSLLFLITFITNPLNDLGVLQTPNSLTDCGKWIDESAITGGNRGISVKPAQQDAIGNTCNGVFTLSNQIKFYTLYLNSTENDATTKFDPYGLPLLIPGLDIEVITTPSNVGSISGIALEGVINWQSASIDSSLWLIRSLLDLAPLPISCPAPSPDQMLLLGIRLAPILENAVKLGLERDFPAMNVQFSKALDAYIDKASELALSIVSECVSDHFKSTVLKNQFLVTQITTGYVLWFGSILIDLIKYGGPSKPTSVILTYIPVPPSPPPTSSTPDGWIAFVNKEDLWVIRSDGSESKSVTNDPLSGQTGNRIIDYAWSPDGKTLAYLQGTDIHLYDIQTAKTTTLPITAGLGFDWSPDGNQIVYATSLSEGCPWCNDGFRVIDLESKNSKLAITSTTNINGMISPEWSYDGSHVLFYIPSVFVPSYEPAGYGIANFSTGKPLKLPVELEEGQTWGNCMWSPQELIIACAVSSNESPKEAVLYLFDENGKAIKEIRSLDKQRVLTFRWSPFNDRLAIGYILENKPYTEILATDTEVAEELTSGVPSDWSPDGQWLLVTDFDENDVLTMFIVNTTTGQSSYLTEGADGIWQPQPVSISNIELPSPAEISIPVSSMDRMSTDSVMEWISYGLANGDVAVFEQLILDEPINYGHGMSGGRNEITRADFLNMLRERIGNFPICEGYIYNEGSSGGSDGLFIITNKWEPQWQDGVVSSDWIGFTFSKGNEGYSLRSAYFQPAGAMLNNQDMVPLIACPEAQ